MIVHLACLSALLTLVLICGCTLEQSPPGRTLHVLPAVLGDPASDPLAVDPDWMPRLPDKAGGRAEEVVAFRLFDRYLYPGEPARGLLRINPHNLPWHQRVHFEVWDEPGLNLLWQDTATLQREESYLVQISPLAGSQFADQTLQIRVRANAFQVTERVYVLPRPGSAGPVAASQPRAEQVAGAAFAVPLPAGPVGPSEEPVSLVATPGETVAAAVVLWPIQSITSVRAELSFHNSSPALARRSDTGVPAAAVRVLDAGKLAPLPAGGVSLRGGLSNVFVATIAVPTDAPPGDAIGRWTFRDADGVELFRRPVSITIISVPLQPGQTVQGRYMATLDAMLGKARVGSFRVRLLAERIERRIDEADSYYASLPPRPLARACSEPRFPHKLRWQILRAIEQLSSAFSPSRL